MDRTPGSGTSNLNQPSQHIALPCQHILIIVIVTIVVTRLRLLSPSLLYFVSTSYCLEGCSTLASILV